jgi:hypothetical protein
MNHENLLKNSTGEALVNDIWAMLGSNTDISQNINKPTENQPASDTEKVIDMESLPDLASEILSNPNKKRKRPLRISVSQKRKSKRCRLI